MSTGKHHEKFGNIEQQPAFNIYPPSQASTQQAIYHPLQASTQQDIYPPVQASTQHRGGENRQKEFVQAMKEQLKFAPIEPFHAKLVPIFRLPNWYHETNKHLYEPKMVAIGPFHNGKDSLRAMEDQKWRSLRYILGCSPTVPLEYYFEKMIKLEPDARNYYSEYVLMEKLDFARMLLLDGCFIIHYFEKLSSHRNHDAICNVGWAKIHLYSDLFLLENQIPFFVIHELITIRNGRSDCQNSCYLLNLFRGTFQKILSPTKFDQPNKQCKDIHHLLQLFYTTIVPPENISNNFHQYPNDHNKAGSVHDDQDQGNNISCVSKLHEAGIKFKKKQNTKSMFDISFDFMNGILEMPVLKVEDTHKVILWNMVAFEQSQLYLYKSQTLSSYLALMDSLIDTEKDVAILEKGGVIENYLQTDEDAAAMFNQFAKSFVLDYSKHRYKSLFLQIKRYSNSGWHKNRARLMHDYFDNPWKIISFIAAVLLLSLTALQTFFTVKPAH